MHTSRSIASLAERMADLEQQFGPQPDDPAARGLWWRAMASLPLDPDVVAECERRAALFASWPAEGDPVPDFAAGARPKC